MNEFTIGRVEFGKDTEQPTWTWTTRGPCCGCQRKRVVLELALMELRHFATEDARLDGLISLIEKELSEEDNS